MKMLFHSPRQALCVCGIGALCAALLAGCNEVPAESTHADVARAVQSPRDPGSPISEVYDVPSYATPLVAVNTSSNPNVRPQVVTIIDPLLHAGATTKPSAAPPPLTVPPGIHFSANPGETPPVVVVQQGQAQDQFAVTSDTDAVPTLTVTSPSGTGTMTLERVGDTWPPVLNLRLQSPEGTAFPTAKSFSAAEVVNEQQRLALKVNNTPGKVQLLIPAFTRGNQIVVGWQDSGQ